MTILTIGESLMDFRRMFRGWRLLLHMALLGLVIIMSRTGGEAEVGYMMMLYCIFSTAFMRPRLNKLFYLLPTRRQDRINCVLIKCLGLFFYNVMLYLAAIMITILLSDYQFTQELPTMLCNVIPVFIAYCSLCMGNGYYLGKSPDEAMTKRYQNRYAVSIIMSIPTMLIALLFDLSFFQDWMHGIVLIVVTVLSYVFAVTCMCSQISVIRHTELSEENIRKIEKLFS